MTDDIRNMPGMTHQPYIAPFLELTPEIDASAFIAATAAIIGAVRIGKNSSIWHQVTVRGDNNYITIGEGTNIQDNSCVHIDSIKFPTIIGNFVTIGHSALIHACTIGDYGFVGMGNGNFVVNSYPVLIKITDIFIVSITVLAIGLVASWYPVKVLSRKLF